MKDAWIFRPERRPTPASKPKSRKAPSIHSTAREPVGERARPPSAATEQSVHGGAGPVGFNDIDEALDHLTPLKESGANTGDSVLKAPRRKDKHILKTKASASRQETQADAATHNHPPEAPSDWLRELHKAVPRPRILRYTYPQLKNETGSVSQYLGRAAKGLLEELARERRLKDREHLPIIFVASGFGGLVVQKAVKLADGSSSLRLNLTKVAGTIFLGTPFPNPKTGESGDKRERIFPKNVNRRMDRFHHESETLIDPLWQELGDLARRMNIVWFHSSVACVNVCTKSWLPTRLTSSVVSNHCNNQERDWSAEKRFDISFINVPTGPRSNLGRISPDIENVGKEITAWIQEKLLFLAVKEPDPQDQLVTALLEHKCNPGPTDNFGMTPLHYAVSWKPSAGQVMALVNHGANPCWRDNENTTPLEMALESASAPENDTTLNDMEITYQAVMEFLLQYSPPRTSDHGAVTETIGATCRVCEGDEYGCMRPGQCWTKWLRDKLSTRTAMFETDGTVSTPNEWQTEISKQCRGMLTEFYGGKPYEQTAPVWDMIYNEDERCAKLFNRLVPYPRGESAPHCRWIHLPANNVRLGTPKNNITALPTRTTTWTC